jgi:anti-anti-sigma regulatory factor
MKLTLRQDESVAILEVAGAIDSHNFLVLKAGVTKLLKDGKNRIVLSLLDATELQGDVIRELAIIDVFARELSGKIIIASTSKELKENVKQFSQPPIIPILSSLEQALDFFRRAQSAAEDEEDVASVRKRLEAKTLEAESLAARLKQLDPKEVSDLRASNAELKGQLQLLQEQVDQLLREKRIPGDVEGFLEKIDALEATVKRLSLPVKS